MHRVVVLTGHTCVGKSRLALSLQKRFGFLRLKTSAQVEEIAEKRGLPTDRSGLQSFGNVLDQEIGHDWVYREVDCILQGQEEDCDLVVDSIRTAKQLEPFRSSRNFDLVHVHLYATKEHILARSRQKHGNNVEYEENDIIMREEDIHFFRGDADVRINTDYTDAEDTLVRVGARLHLFAPPHIKSVDVLVGGQFGSEGKGHVAAYLSKEYDVLMRVGGPNAGHTVSGSDEVYTYHQLPSGSKDTDAEVLLGPGMTIRAESLLKEIEECGIDESRLFIDPQAMIISDEDIAAEGGLKQDIGSTSSGSGSAASRRILGRGDPSIKLARDIPELSRFVGDGEPYRGCTRDRLERAYREGKSILLEGTQGSGLSIYHGTYPYVTSRDTNVAGCLAEAGISPARVRKIILVARTTPIRVGNPDPKGSGEQKTSGPLKHETDFDTVRDRAGLEVDLKVLEKTSTTKRDRRVGWFDWELFQRSCTLNAPTDIALTFVDYLNANNGKAKRFEQLDPNTIKFVEELERVSNAPVSLISTRFPRTPEERKDLRGVIDRRSWRNERKRK